MIFTLMSIEVMLNAAGLAFVAAGARWRQPDGQVDFLFFRRWLRRRCRWVGAGASTLSPVQVTGY